MTCMSTSPAADASSIACRISTAAPDKSPKNIHALAIHILHWRETKRSPRSSARRSPLLRRLDRGHDVGLR